MKMAEVFTVSRMPDTRNLRVRGIFLIMDHRLVEAVQSTGDSKQVPEPRPTPQAVLSRCFVCM